MAARRKEGGGQSAVGNQRATLTSVGMSVLERGKRSSSQQECAQQKRDLSEPPLTDLEALIAVTD